MLRLACSLLSQDTFLCLSQTRRSLRVFYFRSWALTLQQILHGTAQTILFGVNATTRILSGLVQLVPVPDKIQELPNSVS